MSIVTLDDLWEVPPDSELPWLDQSEARPIAPAAITWRADGLLVGRNFMPERLIDAYCAAWDGRWGIGTPYETEPTIQDLCLYPPLMGLLWFLIGQEMGLHLNLTGWRSTERDWHQDDYLNPAFVNGHYAAVWIALADIHPDSGPFEFIRGSNRWPLLRRERVLAAMGEDGTDPDWPWRSEALLAPLFEERIGDLGLEREQFVAKKGDVLVWHPRLLHRGSRPKAPGMERRALIAHYSAISKRTDMPRWATHDLGGRYALFQT